MKFSPHTLPYEQTGYFSNLVLDYLQNNQDLADFIFDFPSPDALKEKMNERLNSSLNRQVLCKSLEEQYKHIDQKPAVEASINLLLQQNTFTICTAHQPNIFTGHLYFIYKIIHAIKLAETCKSLFPASNFVPIYYMGSEDNDLDEIGTLHYQQQTYHWESNETGACGRMQTSSLQPILQEILKTLNTAIPDQGWMSDLLQQAYNGINTLAQATRIIVDELFGHYGLVVIDGDDQQLKSLFVPVMQAECERQDSFRLVQETNQLLSAKYNQQANPRELNLFYLSNQLRARIEKQQEEWVVVDTDIKFTHEALLAELNNHPERFSPNVILRPLYQETILPNIAFIGGGGELAYWMQLKKVFDFHHVSYPILFLRNSVLWIEEGTQKKINQLGLTSTDIFKRVDSLIKHHLSHQAAIQTVMQLEKDIEAKYAEILNLSKTISPVFPKSIEAHQKKANHIHKRMLQKFFAQLKKQDEVRVLQLKSIRSNLFPNETLQERHDNFLSLFTNLGKNMFEVLYNEQQAFGTEFLILSQEV